MSRKETIRILITGNPRSGTTTHQRVLKQCGLDIKHEEMGLQGTVSCYYFVDQRPYPHGHHAKDKKFNKKDFDAIYLLVRDPMKCIPSMRAIISPEHQIWLEKLGFMKRTYINANTKKSQRYPKTYTMAQAWFRTNEYILERLDPTVLMSERLKENITQIVDKQTLSSLERPLDYTWKNASRGIFKAKLFQLDVIKKFNLDLVYDIKDQYETLRNLSKSQRNKSKFRIGAIN